MSRSGVEKKKTFAFRKISKETKNNVKSLHPILTLSFPLSFLPSSSRLIHSASAARSIATLKASSGLMGQDSGAGGLRWGAP